jgi:hypothetical protein
MNRGGALALAVLIAFVLLTVRTVDLAALARPAGVRIALVYTPADVRAGDGIRAAYSESFRESGLPFDWIASTDISLFGAGALAQMYAALVFPDGIDTQLPEEAVLDLQRYAAAGGTIAIVADAGTRTDDGSYRPGSLFAAVSGVNALLYQQLRAAAFTRGALHFVAPAAAARWNVPAGKLLGDDLSSYLYGPLSYPFARAAIVGDHLRIDAVSGTTPLLTRRTVGAGEVAYIALPLGYLRGRSDGFPMTLLVSYLTSRASIPHLVAAPDGIGALIVNLHIDSSNEFLGIPNLRRRGLLRHAVPMEFDVTAGPDLQRVGDGLGFDACGGGRPYLNSLLGFGTIGSHGGWAHNLFAKNLEENRYTPAEVRALVDRNDRCLASVTGKPIRSYAAPVGVHPQPMMTQVLDDLGIAGYYYTGDTGAPAERPFFNGVLVSDKSWAFPIMPFGLAASIAEMRKAHMGAPVVEGWLDGTAAYAAQRHGIYLIYSHSYDLLAAPYALAFGRFLDRVEALERAGTLRPIGMAAAADFMQRFSATRATFARGPHGIDVRLHNDAGLRSIAFALPTAWLAAASAPPPGVRRTARSGGYTIFAVDRDRTDLDVTFRGAS